MMIIEEEEEEAEEAVEGKEVRRTTSEPERQRHGDRYMMGSTHRPTPKKEEDCKSTERSKR